MKILPNREPVQSEATEIPARPVRRILIPKVRTALALLFLLASFSQAGPPWYATTGKLARIGTGLTGEGLYLALDVVTTNNNCRLKQSLMLPSGSPQYQDTLSIALLAFSQARPVDVFYDGSCWGDNVKLYAIALRANP